MKRDIVLDRTDNLIKGVIKTAKSPLSTYEIAKKSGVSWATANIHCYKMMALGFLDCKNQEVKIGMKRMIWWAKK